MKLFVALVLTLSFGLVPLSAQAFNASPTEAAKNSENYDIRKGGKDFVRSVRRSIKNQAHMQRFNELKRLSSGQLSRISAPTNIFHFRRDIRSTQRRATDSDTALARREFAERKRALLRDQYRYNYHRISGQIVEITDDMKTLAEVALELEKRVSKPVTIPVVRFLLLNVGRFVITI